MNPTVLKSSALVIPFLNKNAIPTVATPVKLYKVALHAVYSENSDTFTTHISLSNFFNNVLDLR